MLKGIDPLLTGELLKQLDEMGHGDVLAVVDRNFPSCRYGKPVVATLGADTAAIAQAVLSVFPLDRFVPVAAWRMEVDGEPATMTTGHQAMAAAIVAAEGSDVTVGSIERYRFYVEAEQAMAFVHTGETAPYSCFLLKKGVV